MDSRLGALPDDVEALKAALVAEAARATHAEAELAVAKAKAAYDQALANVEKVGVQVKLAQDNMTFDYLLVDLPPGTGNESVTTIDLLGNVSGAVIITTPQEVALLDSRKSVTFCKDSEVPIIGIVENMSYYRCPDNGKEYAIFGPSHADEIAIAAGVPVWARLPIDPQVTVLCDAGKAEELDLPEFQSLAMHVIKT